MKTFFDFLRKNFWLILLLSAIPIIVILIFLISEFICNKIDMSAGEWSGLFSAAFGYWGTMILGVVSFWQNEKLSEANDKLSRLQLEEFTPYLIIDDVYEIIHLDEKRLPDTSQSILYGKKGFQPLQGSNKAPSLLVEQSKTGKEMFEEKQNKLMEKIIIDDISELTADKTEEIGETYVSIAELNNSLPRATITEAYIDTFWILSSDVIRKEEHLNICRLIDEVEYPQKFYIRSVKVILKNNSSASIKKIIFNKMMFNWAFNQWEFIPNTEKNSIKNILSPEQELIIYINLYIFEDDELKKDFIIHNVYDISLDLELQTIGSISQSEIISAKVAFRSLSEYEVELY